MNNDFENYDDSLEMKILEDNSKWLALFEESMADLSEKTIRTHMQNVSFYINDYLVYYEGVDSRQGITCIDTFLSDYFVRKCMWSTPSTIKSNVTSLKKFYKFLRDHGQIEKQQYDSLCEEIKVNQEFWQENCRKYNEDDDYFYGNMYADDSDCEATLDQYRELYELTDAIHELAPWEKFSDRDIICVSDGIMNTYYNILGNAGISYGIVVYEDEDGLEDYMINAMSDRMNISPAYAMNRQHCIALYWGEKEELTDEATEILKKLGRTYQGKNQWPYFLSFEPGYMPWNLDAEEADSMINCLEDLVLALKKYQSKPVKVDYEKGKMLLCSMDYEKTTCECMEADIPFMGVDVPSLHLQDPSMYKNLKKQPKSQVVLELDVCPSGIMVNDPMYRKPANAVFSMICEAKSGFLLAAEISAPDEDPHIKLVQALVSFMEEHGLPKEIRVTNIFIEAVLKELTDECKIKLRKVKKLPKIEEAMQGIREMQPF